MEKAKKILIVFVFVSFFISLFPVISFATAAETASEDPYPFYVPTDISFAYVPLPSEAFYEILILDVVGTVYAFTFDTTGVCAHYLTGPFGFRRTQGAHYKTYKFDGSEWVLYSEGSFTKTSYITDIPPNDICLYFCNTYITGIENLSHKPQVFEISDVGYLTYCEYLINAFGDNGGGDNGGGDNGGGQDYSGFFGNIIGKLVDIWNSIKNLPATLTDLKDKVVNGFTNLLSGLLDGLDYLFNPNNPQLDGSFSEAISEAFAGKFEAFNELQEAFNFSGWNGELEINVPINFLGFETNIDIDFSWYEPYRQQVRSALAVLLWVMCFLMNYRLIMSTLRLYVGSGAAGIYQANEAARKLDKD